MTNIPEAYQRKSALSLPAMSELDVVRHYTHLSQKNFCIDTGPYPLGSCTMKYNPKIAHQLAMLPGLLRLHPHQPEALCQGVLQTLHELQAMLCKWVGMEAVSLAPMAGAQGEFAGVRMIRAYHEARGDAQRTEMLVPDAAHGTNPASAVACGLTVKSIPTTASGNLDLQALKEALGPKTAGIMLTNPSTLGVFEEDIREVADCVHRAGGLLYYDGANLNAILGRARVGDMGFDVMHLNLHKTFATPHGSGGPGAGPVAANARLAPFLPLPYVIQDKGRYRWLAEQDRPQSIGRLSAFHGNVGVLMRAFVYAAMLGDRGAKRVSEYAVLNANYLMKRLESIGYTLAFPDRRASHEFVITLAPLKALHGVTALDVAKRLLDYGIHSPTVYFPLLVPECLLIEPTETESRESLDVFVAAMADIFEDIQTSPERVKQAPHTCPVGRLDEVKAARDVLIGEAARGRDAVNASVSK